MKKYIFSLMILFFYMSSISAQEKYSVDEFLKQITKTKQFPIKKIDEKKLEWTEDDIFCDREITSCNRSIRNNCAKIYLSEKDFSSIESQYLALSDSLWNMEEINSFKIIDNKKIKKIDKKMMELKGVAKITIMPFLHLYFQSMAIM